MELQDNGNLTTLDEPHVVFGFLDVVPLMDDRTKFTMVGMDV